MIDQSKCEACPVHNTGNLKRLGINMDKFDFVVALAGNPNTGKSTVFNNLTGLKQHTGNWPGKTVTRAEGGFEFNNSRYKLIDLPGTYSLLSTSTDEEIARDFILFGQPDVTIVVVDATRLERNLNLVLQVLEITDRAIVCLNLMDEARRRYIEIDERTLSRDLGIPVIPTEARQGIGIPNLLTAIDEVVNGKFICKPYRITGTSKGLAKAVEYITEKIKRQFPLLPNARWVALRLLEGDQKIIDAIRSGEISGIAKRNSVEENFAAV
ncbi:MAG: iron transporter FeoB [Ignavibacteria bacterium RIFOXYB2_FULL_36_7]|nr:MAG: iron transporter FeoB [Ignavibacteria bacterium RIFOXYB2_FULL_36_7]